MYRLPTEKESKLADKRIKDFKEAKTQEQKDKIFEDLITGLSNATGEKSPLQIIIDRQTQQLTKERYQ